MTIMCIVKASNHERVSKGFTSFQPSLDDRYLDIKTFNPADPTVHCLYTQYEHNNYGLMYPPGFYVFVELGQASLLWHYPTTDLDKVDELISVLTVENTFDPAFMQECGFTAAYHFNTKK